MQNYIFFRKCIIFLAFISSGSYSFGANNDAISFRHKVALPEAPIGNLEIETLMLNSYGFIPDNIQNFYISVRTFFEEEPGVEQVVILDVLVSDAEYNYIVYSQKNIVGEGKFMTAPATDENKIL